LVRLRARGGRFFEKKLRKKLFLRGQRYVASFSAEKLGFSASSKNRRAKESKLSFARLFFGPWGFLSLAIRIPTKMTWIAPSRAFLGGAK